MTDANCLDEKNTTLDFSVAAARHDASIIELVRHLARISAETDYRAFLKSIETRYNGGLQKGPPQ